MLLRKKRAERQLILEWTFILWEKPSLLLQKKTESDYLLTYDVLLRRRQHLIQQNAFGTWMSFSSR